MIHGNTVEFSHVTLGLIPKILKNLQADLDDWLEYYNGDHTHQRQMRCGKTPMETREKGKEIWQKKLAA